MSNHNRLSKNEERSATADIAAVRARVVEYACDSTLYTLRAKNGLRDRVDYTYTANHDVAPAPSPAVVAVERADALRAQDWAYQQPSVPDLPIERAQQLGRQVLQEAPRDAR